jgi:3-isopropylmalate dehydratase
MSSTETAKPSERTPPVSSTDAFTSTDALTVIRGIAAPLHLSNVDTDMIIPGRYLAVIKKSGLGTALFYPLRYTTVANTSTTVAAPVPNPTFILNRSPFTHAKFLFVTGENFGCGSSREHAPWALKDFGIRVVLAPSFAGIFFNNCFKNSVLCVVFPEGVLLEMAREAEEGGEFELNLEEQWILRPGGERVGFEVDGFKKWCLLNGFDEIALTLRVEGKISEYEEWRGKEFPWLEEEGCKMGGNRKIRVLSGKAKAVEW